MSEWVPGIPPGPAHDIWILNAQSIWCWAAQKLSHYGNRYCWCRFFIFHKEVATGKLNPCENLPPKQAAPGSVSAGKFCTRSCSMGEGRFWLFVLKLNISFSGVCQNVSSFHWGKLNYEELSGLQCPVKAPGWVKQHVWLHKDTELCNGRFVAQIILVTGSLIGPSECLWCDKDVTAGKNLFSVQKTERKYCISSFAAVLKNTLGIFQWALIRLSVFLIPGWWSL